MVSIPSGLPKPFHLRYLAGVQMFKFTFQFQADFPSHFTSEVWLPRWQRSPVSIPSGLPKPFHPDMIGEINTNRFHVSIPSGLPNPFHPTGIVPLTSLMLCFNSKRTSQAISPTSKNSDTKIPQKFQFPADFPSHFTPSNPTETTIIGGCFNSKRTSQAISPWKSWPQMSWIISFNSKRTSQAISPVLITPTGAAVLVVSIPSGLPKPFHLYGL